MLPITDQELFTALCKGIQFLGLSYDIFPAKDGYTLRIVNDFAQIVYSETFQNEADLIQQLRIELEETAVAEITGQRRNIDQNWGRHG